MISLIWKICHDPGHFRLRSMSQLIAGARKRNKNFIVISKHQMQTRLSKRVFYYLVVSTPVLLFYYFTAVYHGTTVDNEGKIYPQIQG